MRRSLLFMGAVLLLSVQMFASVVAVGTCKPKVPHYNTIQQAVDSTPAGSTIDVCPGTYPEQVTIPDSLTLVGISANNQGAAVITAPAGGVVPNATSLTSGAPIAAQILVQASSGTVTINNLTIDGSNNGITGCSPNLVGIYYQNASGTITRSNVINQALSADLNGCQSGLGVFVQSGNGGVSTVSVTNSHVENYQKNGITGNEPGTRLTVSGNTVVGQGVTSGAAENSIQIGFGATGSVMGNTVGSDDYIDPSTAAAAGILVYASSSINVSKNNVSNTQLGISVDSDPNYGSADGATISANTVSATHAYDGIDACSNSNSISRNIVNGSDQSAIHLDDSCTGSSSGNVVNANTINGACAGVLVGPSASGSITSNHFYNAGTLVMTGSDTCTPPLVPKKNKTKAATGLKPARP